MRQVLILLLLLLLPQASNADSINADQSSITTAGGGYSTVQDEASALTSRSNLNFIGAGVSCVDNSGSSRTDCTIAGGGTPATEVVRAQTNTAQTVTSSGNPIITFEQEAYDTDTMHDNSTNNGRITFTTAGVYLVWGKVLWDDDTNSTGFRQITIERNGVGTDEAIDRRSPTGVAGEFTTNHVMYEDTFVATDYVELHASQNSGVTLSTRVGNTKDVAFGARRMGD